MCLYFYIWFMIRSICPNTYSCRIYLRLIFIFTVLFQTAESYFYVPDLGEVPDLDVPSYLPDLPGIADDLSYSADLGPGFAPSGFLQSIPELPSFVSSSASCLQICGYFCLSATMHFH